MSTSKTSLNHCLICGKETALDIGVHSCGTTNSTSEITMNNLLARIEGLEYNYRELLKALKKED